MTAIFKMRLVIIVLVAQLLGLVLADGYLPASLLGDAPLAGDAFEGDYYDGPGPAMMPLSPAAALQGLLMNADPSLLLSVASPSPPSTPLLCRMFPSTVRCQQYRFPFTGESIAPRVDTGVAEPSPPLPSPHPSPVEDGPEEQQHAPSYHPPLSYQYVLLGVPSTSAVHPVAPMEPCRVGFNNEQQQPALDPDEYQQRLQQHLQMQLPAVNPCPGAQKLPQPSTSNMVVGQQIGADIKVPAPKAPEAATAQSS